MSLPFHPQPKPSKPWNAKKGPTARSRARRRRAATKDTPEIRAYVFGREREICRICRSRRAQSMHEVLFRSLGGKVSKTNSIAACGDGVNGCHGFAQRNEIRYQRGPLGANGTMSFQPVTVAAAEWMRVKVGQWIESPVMAETEIAPC